MPVNGNNDKLPVRNAWPHGFTGFASEHTELLLAGFAAFWLGTSFLRCTYL